MELVENSETANAGQLTLDAVAAKAGVSKGGLLHHFKSKEALLTAMIERLAEDFELERQRGMERLNTHAGDTREHEVELICAYLDRGFSGLGARNRSAMTLFAAATHQQALLQPIRDYFARRNQLALTQTRSPQAMIALMLLADGMWLFDALGIPPVTGKLREDLTATIKDWARQVIENGGLGPEQEAVKKKAPAKTPRKAASTPKG